MTQKRITPVGGPAQTGAGFRAKEAGPDLSTAARSIAKMLESSNAAERIRALEMVSEPKALAYIANYSQYPDLRTAALEKIGSDIQGLIDVTKGIHQHEDLKVAAANKLARIPESFENPDACFAITRHTTNSAQRKKAVDALTKSKKLLFDVILCSKYDGTRLYAFSKINATKEELERIAKESGSPRVRVQAVEMLAEDKSNLDTLVRLTYESWSHIALRIVNLLATRVDGILDAENAEALSYIARDSDHERARILAVNAIADNVKALSVVVRYSGDAAHADAVTKAIEYLATMVDQVSDPYMLREIAGCSRNSKARKKALEKLSAVDNIEELVRLAHSVYNTDTSNKAFEILKAKRAKLEHFAKTGNRHDGSTNKAARLLEAMDYGTRTPFQRGIIEMLANA